MSTSWNRRVAAASRVRDNVDPDGIEDRLAALGLPRGLHPDDAVAIVTLGMTSIAAAFTGVIFGEEVESGLATAAPFIVFGYTALFSCIGAFVGSLIGGGKPPQSE